MIERNLHKMGSVREASELFGLSTKIIYGLCKTNQIAYLKSGKKFLVNLDALGEWLDTQRGETA